MCCMELDNVVLPCGPGTGKATLPRGIPYELSKAATDEYFEKFL